MYINERMKKVKKVKEIKEVKKFETTVWPFEIDTVETWCYYHPIFSKEECEKIIDIGTKRGFLKAIVQKGLNTEIRDSNISWLYPSDDLEWAYRRLTDVIMDLNSKYFKFDLFGFTEGFQFTHYKEPYGKYKKHVDRGKNHSIRKLSMSVQLSDPEDYVGGDFMLYEGEEPTILPKEQGKLILFPSYVLHEVKPVTKGERYSLVTWITGPSFK